MKKIYYLAFLLTINLVMAQTPNWTWAKNISLGFNSKQDMTAVDNQGNVYLVGDFITPTVTIGGTTLTNTSDAGYSDAYILKFNPTGTLLWTKQISTNLHDSIYSIATDNLGNCYIYGLVGNTIMLGATTITGGYFAKLDSNGNFIWAKKNMGTNEYHYIRDIKADAAGNVFITGYMSSATLTFDNVVMSFDSNSPSVNNHRVFIAKFDSSGTCLWGKIATSNEANVFGTLGMSVAPDTNGGAAICGRFSHNTLTFGNITLTKTTQDNNSSNMFVAKYDGNGNVMWAYNAGSIDQDNTMGSVVAVDSNNNVYAGGSFPNSVQFGSTVLYSGTGSQLYLVKYAPNGTCLWAKTTGFGTNGYTTVRSITTDEIGNVYTAGLAYASAINFDNNITINNLGNLGAFFVTKYNSQGTTIWAKGVPNIDANNDISIDCKAENDLFIGGSFDKSTLQLGSIVLTKSAANFDLFIGRLYLVPLSTTSFDAKAISIYPNPARNNVHLANLQTTYAYSLYTILGTCIQKGYLQNEQETLDISALQAGLYLIKLTDSNNKVSQKKIIIE